MASRHPNCRYILTSRIVGYDGCAVENRGKAIELVLFGQKEIERFVRAWFSDSEVKRDGFLRALRGNASLRGLARNPLMLSLLCLVYSPNGMSPERTTDLYRKCLEGFLRG